MGVLSFYKNLERKKYDVGEYYIEDTSATSPSYFDIQEIPSSVGGGRHVIIIKGGLGLRDLKDVDIEIIASDGSTIFVDSTDYVDRFDNYYFTFEIYDRTEPGVAEVYLVGEAIVDEKGGPIPEEWRDEYNVRWSGEIIIQPFERNNSNLTISKAPQVSLFQVVTPERALIEAEGSGFQTITSSLDDLRINSTNFSGYDREFSNSTSVIDSTLFGLLKNTKQKPTTVNTIQSYIRTKNADIRHGYTRQFMSRYNNTITSDSGFFRKDFLGGSISFTSGAFPTKLEPTLPSNYSISGSAFSQLEFFEANIVDVVSANQIVIDKPVAVSMLNTNSKSKLQSVQHRYKNVENFQADITFKSGSVNFVTSSTVSQSYLEFTFQDLQPLSGEIYRIKTYYKKGVSTGEYQSIYDHVVVSPEYLVDATYPNQTSYATKKSDYRLIGHFTDSSIIENYWSYYAETPSSIYIGNTPVIQSQSLADSIKVRAQGSTFGIFSTTNYQAYAANQIYTIAFTALLDPQVELEVYMNSNPLSTNTYISTDASIKAFANSVNSERSRYQESFSRFGKYIGSIANKKNKQQHYGHVEFDFETDDDGVGAPVFRTKTLNQYITGSAHISLVSITPLAINGFSPNLVQFAVPFSNEITQVLALSQSLDFKIEYFDYTGKQSEYVTFLEDVQVNLKTEIPNNGCQAELSNFFIPGTAENY